MPYLDGTGPNGLGPKTGQGLGKCSNLTTKTTTGTFGQGFGRGQGQGFGRGQGQGFGRGRGRNVVNSSFLERDNSLIEKERLEETKRILEEQLKQTDQDLNNL